MNKVLVGTVVTALLFIGCTEEKKTTVEVTSNVTSSKSDETISKQTIESSPSVVEKDKEEIKENIKVEEIKQEVKDKEENIQKIEDKPLSTTQTKVEEDKVVVADTKEEGIVQKEQLNGELLYKTCVNCHGQKAEKEALGKSQIIAGWDKQRIIDAMNGYKNGTYGGVMKNIMKGQVATKTDAEIEALAIFISNL